MSTFPQLNRIYGGCDFMKKINIALLGGDMRQNYLALELFNNNFNIFTFAQENGIHSFEQLNDDIDIDVYIFPMPISMDSVHLNCKISDNQYKLCDIIDKIPKNSLILGGSISPTVRDIFSNRNYDIIDYLEREELAILNAIPTAEGALEIAFREMNTTIHGSKSLVLGNGRIGKVLSKKLHSLGSCVTVCARNFSDFADISSNNMNYIGHNDIIYSDFDVIFNTIPKLVLDNDELDKVLATTLIIDLASRPGGVNFTYADKIGINAIWALSLPGKVAPISSANYIHQTILNILTELEVI